MVRGVHKRVIEVQNLPNECFERAFLIVKENFKEEKAEVLERKAGEYVRQVGTVVLNRRKAAGFWKKASLFLAAAVILLLVGTVFFLGR